MTVKEIIKTSATLLGREDVVNYITGDLKTPDDSTLYTVDALVRCLNLVVNELACTYIPMKKTQTFRSETVYYLTFYEKPLSIIKVTDLDGYDVEYQKFPDKIVVKKFPFTIEYNYIPKSYILNDSVGYLDDQISIRALAYGTLSEYSLIEHAFTESVMWHKKYMDAVAEVCMPKNAKIKSRSWLK